MYVYTLLMCTEAFRKQDTKTVHEYDLTHLLRTLTWKKTPAHKAPVDKNAHRRAAHKNKTCVKNMIIHYVLRYAPGKDACNRNEKKNKQCCR